MPEATGLFGPEKEGSFLRRRLKTGAEQRIPAAAKLAVVQLETVRKRNQPENPMTEMTEMTQFVRHAVSVISVICVMAFWG